MNLFVLDKDPYLSAIAHCDKHVVQMCREGLWILRAAHWLLTGEGHKPGWINHPVTEWAINSYGKMHWMLSHTEWLFKEYTHRYGKTHALDGEFQDIRAKLSSFSYPKSGDLDNPWCKIVPADCTQDDAIEAYRHYYNTHKYTFARWTNREPPEWWNPFLAGKHE
jgi:hypothetical protein